MSRIPGRGLRIRDRKMIKPGPTAAAPALPCVAAGHADPVVHERLRGERERLDDHIAALEATRDRLDVLIRAAKDTVPAA